tara:strand:+ start:163 stop:399 length:237 start_codon:yes stop_codon:yes gene_type:complete
MKRLILIALIPALVGCAGMTKQQQSLVGGVGGAVVGYQLAGAKTDQVWATLFGTLAGAMIGNAFEAITESRDWWRFWD